MDAVKMEGGSPSRVASARAIVEAGVAVMGHVGLVPQSISVLGGFRPQGQTASAARRTVEQALALQEAGCFAVVLECLPPAVAAAVTRALQIPTIGIGAGGGTSGQVLVYHDLLGMMTHPHHAKVTPKFCKQYARVGDTVQRALQEFKSEVGPLASGTVADMRNPHLALRAQVESRAFPSRQYSPYKMSRQEVETLIGDLRSMGLQDAADAALAEVEAA